MSRQRRQIALALVLSTVCSAASASLPVPAVRIVDDVSDLPVHELVTWGQLGPSGSFIEQPFTIEGELLGIDVVVLKNNAVEPFERVDQGTDWFADFAPGEQLLHAVTPTAFDIRFDSPVFAVGTQISAVPGHAFQPLVLAIAGDEQLFLGTLPVHVTTSAGDDSAPFIGVFDPQGRIDRVLFDSGIGGVTAINELRVAIVIPEPTGAALALLALGTLVSVHRRRSS
jgi:hypothetical protein